MSSDTRKLSNDPTESPPDMKRLLDRLRSAAPNSRRHEVVGEIGRGGMSRVLEVLDIDLDRRLAMKVMAANARVDAALIDRFVAEAQITGKLDHPGVVPVHEIGVDDAGELYFTMRLIRGRQLGEVFGAVADGSWSLTRVVEVLLRVCETMAFAHARGVVHRDLKPQNVLVGRFGETYVVDWGVAKLLGQADPQAGSNATWVGAAGDPVETTGGTILGTPAYMAPEQASGLEVDERTDVYAVGALLYEALAGCPPFGGGQPAPTAHAVVAAVRRGPPRPLAEVARHAPAELSAICDKAMARDPAGRYPSMLALAADLRAFTEGRVVAAWPVGPWAELTKWVRRNRQIATLSGLLLATVLVGALAFSLLQLQRSHELGAAQALTLAARDTALANEAEARWQSYLANIVAADASLRLYDAAEARRRLLATPPLLRGWEWQHLLARSDSSDMLAQHDGPLTTLVRQGDTVFAGDDGGVIGAWQGGELTAQWQAHTAGITALVSHDGQLLSASEDGTVASWQDGALVRRWELGVPVASLAAGPGVAAGLASGAIELLDRDLTLEGHADSVGALAFDPTGTRLVSGSRDGDAREWVVASGRGRVVAAHGDEVTAVVYGPDGQVASGSLDRSVRISSAEGGSRELGARNGPVNAAVFSPDGARLAVAGFDQAVYVLDTATGEVLQTRHGHLAPVTALDWSHGLASASEDGTLRAWPRQEPSAALRGDGQGLAAVAVSADGALLATAPFGEGAVRLLDADLHQLLRPLEAHQGTLADLAFDPAGRRLAGAGFEDATLHVWDTASGRLLASMQGHEASVNAVAFSADGTVVWSASSDGKAIAWDPESAAPRAVVEAHDALHALALQASGARLALGAESGDIELHDLVGGGPPRRIPAHEGAVTALVFGGDWLASGGADRRVRVWDVATGELRHELLGHASRITGLATDEGGRLFSSSFDHTVRVWSAERATPVLILRSHEGPVTGLGFGGHRLATASLDDSVRLWEAPQADASSP